MIRNQMARGFMPLLILAVVGVAVAIGGAAVFVYNNSKPHADEPPAAEAVPLVEDAVPTPATSTSKSPAIPAAKPTNSGSITSQTHLNAASGEALQIQNVDSQVSASLAVITWTTSLPAESQLVLESGKGKGYQSTTGISTTHEVDIENPVESKEYDFEILASTPDKKLTDDYFGSFTAIEKFTASFGTAPSSVDCVPIIIKNTAGKLAAGKQVSMNIYLKGGAQLGLQSYTTNARGEIDTWSKCEAASKVVITGTGIEMTLER